MKPIPTLLWLSLLCASAGAQIEDALFPPEYAVLQRTHVRLRWPAVSGLISDYTVLLVEDDGSANPFAGTTPLLVLHAPAEEPRVDITSKLEFGRDYAWRVIGVVGPPPGLRRASPIHRFTTASLPAWVPNLLVEAPQGLAAVSPGVTLFNYSIGTDPDGHALAVENDGGVVWFYTFPGRQIGDLEQLPDGHLLWNLRPTSLNGPGGRAVEMTLDGRWVAVSPDEPDLYSVHHEVGRLPNGNYLLLLYDDRVLPGVVPPDWQGDRIVEFDRHTWEIVRSWSTFDAYDIQDYHPQLGPGGDWTHGNSAEYDPRTRSVWFSARRLSRITRIFWPTTTAMWSIGETSFPSGTVTVGDNLFSFQHAVEPLPDGNLLVFDNGNEIEPLNAPRQSRAVEVAVDDPDQPQAASIVWEYDLTDENGAELFIPFVGDVDRLANGHTLVTAGTVSRVDEVDPAGSLVWRMTAGVGFPADFIYRSERVPTLLVDTPGDADSDGDLDLRDLAALQVAADDPGPLAFPRTLLDLDGDDELDQDDFRLFTDRMRGPAR